ncbi:methionine synthase [Streptomyces viridochromogenes]|uniref:Methionine synthase n=2 Tax=Streptomyces viridochromogenes TaxID=1938 RepID=A0A0J7ZKH4_STRVR|nr:methionine synthase [Streptomyces viridochromogenes]KOG10944.1 methionine synthase [Streptomyces viridochromogenes]KOG13097.1 methionine synthase [Streptomyces viridochromogenes]
MPGGDAREAARTVTGSFEDFPYLAELPARGPGADMIGRTAGMLVELYARVEPSGWRIGDRPGRDTRRARSWLGEDLDALEEFTQGYDGQLKIQAVGPWTLAAALELRNGEAALSDAGACRDLTASLAEGLRLHLEEVHRRIPGAQLVLQLDEPSLTAVLRGQVKSASGYRTHRAVDRQIVEAGLRDVVGVHGDGPVVVHSCAPDVPFALLRRAGATAISFDFSLLTERDDDTIGEVVEAGTRLFAGVIPGTDGRLSDPAGSVMGVRTLWRRLGLSPGLLAKAVTVTPSCGLAGASPEYARKALAHCVQAARSLADNPE